MSKATRHQTAEAAILTRAATNQASTWNEERRTVDVIMSSGAAVARRSWADGPFQEILEISKQAVDLSRCDGMSVLDSHQPYTMDNRIGTIVPGTTGIVAGNLVATVRLSRNPLGESLAQDLRDGHPFSVSVGYRIDEFVWSEGADGEASVLTATRWTPLELSAVAIPADPAARTRSLQKGHDMDPEDLTDLPTTRVAPPARRPPAETERATLAERTRSNDITALGQRARLDEATIRNAITAGTSVETFRAQVFDAIIAREENTQIFSHRSIDAPVSTETDYVRANAEAQFARMNPSHKLPDAAREFAHTDMLTLARNCVERTGTRVAGQSRGEIISRALHSTSDFPLILNAVTHMTLAAGYADVDSSIKLAARATTHSDFREKARLNVGDGPELKKVNEHGEFTRGTLVEGKEAFALATYGKIIGFTRQAIINDQLGAFTQMLGKWGRRAAQLEATILAGIIETNGEMGDDLPIFCAQHGNLLAGASLSVASLSVGRLAFRKQKDINGELIGVAPSFLIVPSELETAGEQVLAEIAATETAAVNPFAKKLSLLVEPRLEDPQAWYLAAAPGSVPGLEYAHLEGEVGPQTENRVGFDVDGIEYKVRLDFGAGMIDHRGWAKNPGQ